ncbi:MAG: hypothetical protein AAFV47_09180 [Pseudomonadota bacterium]
MKRSSHSQMVVPSRETIRQLPDGIAVQQAPLPEVYEAATKALAECERIDECKDCADNAKALASCSKQIENDTLESHAARIKARAIRRAGELIERIAPSTRGGP